MHTGIQIAWTIILAVSGWVYLVWEELKETGQSPEEKKTVLRRNIRLHIYMASSLLFIAGYLIVNGMLNAGGSLTGKLKTITLIIILFCAAWTDFHKMIIPNRLIVGGLVIRLGLYAAEFLAAPQQFLGLLQSDFFACLVVLFFFVMGVFVIKSGIGMGDIKLLTVLGLYQGFVGMFSAVFFSLCAALIGAVYMMLVKKKKRKDSLPFAPFVLIGTYLAVILTVY